MGVESETLATLTCFGQPHNSFLAFRVEAHGHRHSGQNALFTMNMYRLGPTQDSVKVTWIIMGSKS